MSKGSFFLRGPRHPEFEGLDASMASSTGNSMMGGRLPLLAVWLAALCHGRGGTAVYMYPLGNRTMTFWATASNPVVNGRPSCSFPPCANWSDGSADWEARLALLTKHRANLTGIIPAMHAVVDGGKLGLNGDGSYHAFLPYLPRLRAMGLEITAFLGNAGRSTPKGYPGGPCVYT